MPPFNWFDALIVIGVLFSTISGLRAGLARVVVSIVAAVVGLMAGFWCYRLAGARIQTWVGSQPLSNVLGFLLIFCAVLIAGAIIAGVLSKIFQWVGLSWFNHFLGGVAGALRGAIVIAALLDFLVAFSPSPMPAFLSQSSLMPYASQFSSAFVNLAPRELKDAFTQQLSNLKAVWRTANESATPHNQHAR